METARLENVSSLTVVLTASCNLRCTYCYENDKNGKKMEWDTLRESIDLLSGSDREEVGLTFYGGEPLLQFELMRRAVEHVTRNAGRLPRIRYSTITNGLLLTPQVAEFLVANDVETRISFDGAPAAQELRGRGTWARLDRLLDRLARDHPRFFRERISVSMVLMSTTIRYFADSIEYMLGKGIRSIHISPVDTHDAAWTPDVKDRLDEQFARVFELSVRHYEETGRIPLQLFRHASGPQESKPRGRGMCGVGSGEQLTVDADGEVVGCATFAASFQKFSPLLEERLTPMRMGHVADAALSDRLALYPAATRAAKIFNRKQDKYSSYGKCGECRFLADCDVCPVSIGYIPGNTDPDRIADHLCAYNLVTCAWAERFPRRNSPLDTLLGRAPLPESLRRVQEWVDRA